MQDKIRIAFFDTKPYDRLSFDAIKERYPFEIAYFETRLTPVSAKLAEGFDVVCAFVNDDLCAETIHTLTGLNVRLAAMRCAGFNNVDLGAACKHLKVVHVPKYSPYAVAEYTLGLLLCLNRHLHRAFCRIRENNFSINGFLGFDLHGKTFGIVGTGKIGLTFAQLLGGFGVRILAFDPFPNQKAAAELKMEYVSLETLYRESNVISLHCPLTTENRYMINPDALDMMKDGVFILNTSRGKLIDTAALINALKSGKVGGAGLDVYEEEADYFFEDRSDSWINDDILARLMTFPNVLVTSHQAFFTREAMGNIAEITLDNIRDFIEGRELVNDVCLHCNGSKPSCHSKENTATANPDTSGKSVSR